MKIVNKYVNIDIGRKSIRKHNFFLNSYLKFFSKCQLYNEYTPMKNLSLYLYIKLDTPLSGIDENSTLYGDDFDLRLSKGKINQITNKNNISAIYTFSNEVSFEIREGTDWVEYTDRSILDGRKITAVSFYLQTFLDIDEYNLYFTNGEILNISREDLITSDAMCDGYPYPYHLSVEPISARYEAGGATYSTYVSAKVYSVGLGYTKGIMNEEYVIGEDAIINEEDDYTFSFVITKAKDEGIYPGENVQPMTPLHPLTFRIATSEYPSVKLYSSDNLHPTVGDLKYIIIKYKLYYVNRGLEEVYTGDEYTMSFYTEKFGVLTVKDKIERSN